MGVCAGLPPPPSVGCCDCERGTETSRVAVSGALEPRFSFDVCPEELGSSASPVGLTIEARPKHYDVARSAPVACAHACVAGHGRDARQLSCRLLSVTSASPPPGPRVDGDDGSPPSCPASSRNSSRTPEASAGEDAPCAIREIHGEFFDAVRGARVAEALRALPRHPPAFAPEAESMTQVRRVAARLSQCEAAFVPAAQDGWMVERLAGACGTMEFRCRLAGGSLSMVCTAEYRSGDTVKALAALCEGDMCQGYRPSTVSAELLGERGIMESLWRVRRRSSTSGIVKDNLSEVSVVDALDESSGSLWVVMQSPAPGVACDIYGVTVPPEVRSSERCKDEGTIFRITPSWSSGSSVPHGFSLSSVTCSHPSGASLALLSSMPSFALRAVIRRRALELTDAFGRHVQTCGELDERLRTSRWASFYSEVRQRLISERPPVSSSMSSPRHVPGEVFSAAAPGGKESTTPSTTSPSMDSAMNSDAGDAADDHVLGEVVERCGSLNMRHALDQAVKA